MTMAADKKRTEYLKQRPTSAPDVTVNIPKIVLVDKTDSPSTDSKSELTSQIPSGATNLSKTDVHITEAFSQVRGPDDNTGSGKTSRTGSFDCHVRSGLVDHPPIRSSSDIGLPTASMTNLALQIGGGIDGSKENYLGVYCSPRTSRRSVDLDSKTMEDTRQFEWSEPLDSSSNSLKVLSASSRVGSALSLNSECTARSIGLLSNDSDSDNDVSLSEKDRLSDKPAQLRRFMSHPEEGAPPGVGTRTSQSLCNLKSAHTLRSIDTDLIADSDLDTMASSLDNTSSLDDGLVIPTQEVVTCDKNSSANKRNPELASTIEIPKHNKESLGGRDRGMARRSRQRLNSDMKEGPVFSLPGEPTSSSSVPGRSPHMLCYKRETHHDTSRDGRIRQWLQDMDKNGSYSNG